MSSWKNEYRSFYYENAPEPDDIVINKGSSALLVIDIQNTYLDDDNLYESTIQSQTSVSSNQGHGTDELHVNFKQVSESDTYNNAQKYENELKDEIIVAADELQSLLNYKIKNFAYTFGDINSINKLSINLASKRFDFIFSGLRGNNLKKSKIVAREAINFYSDITLNHAILNGIYDLFYKTKLNKLKKWV